MQICSTKVVSGRDQQHWRQATVDSQRRPFASDLEQTLFINLSIR